MKRFLIVFEDVLNTQIHDSSNMSPASCTISEISKEALIKRFELKEFKGGRHQRQCYWDGKFGDVLIYIYEISSQEVNSVLGLNALVQKMHDRWL